MKTVLIMFLLCSTYVKFGESSVLDMIKPQDWWDTLKSTFKTFWTNGVAILTDQHGKKLDCAFRIPAMNNKPSVCVQVSNEPATDWGCDNPTDIMPSEELETIASFVTRSTLPKNPKHPKARPMYCKDKNTIYIDNEEDLRKILM